MNVADPRIRIACLTLLSPTLLTIAGCPSFVGIVVVPTEVRAPIHFTSGNTMTYDSSSAGNGPVDPREDTTIDVIVYSDGPLTAGDLSISVQLLAGDTEVQNYPITLEQTAFEPYPSGVLPGAGLDTRYAARLVASCASCNPRTLLPQSYQWRTTATRASGVFVSGVAVFNYSVYMGPVVAP